MPTKAPSFRLYFEVVFLENYTGLGVKERKLVDKAVSLLASNPRHPSLNVHKAKNVKSKYAEGGDSVFIAYVTKDLRFTFEYGPEPGMIALRNCGHHDVCERRV